MKNVCLMWCLLNHPRGIARFLRHLWSTDGCINLSQGQKHYASIYYASSSMELARQVQSLLLRLGINAMLSRHAQVGKGRDQYHVSVSGKPDIERFIDSNWRLESVKKWCIKQLSVIAWLRRYAKTNRDVLPREAMATFCLYQLCKLLEMTGSKMQGSSWLDAYCGAGHL